MTVAELIQRLLNCDQNAHIELQVPYDDICCACGKLDEVYSEKDVVYLIVNDT